MPKDPDPQDGRARGGSSRASGGRDSAAAKAGAKAVGKAAKVSSNAGSRAAGGRAGSTGGRTRPPAAVVAQPRPWGLIAGALAVVLFAGVVITYAVTQVNESQANQVSSPSQISGQTTFEYAAGQEHVNTPVTYEQTPPVGGPHDGEWADCTGTVYPTEIRHENAVHSLEHGAVWITYDPAAVSDGDLQTLEDLVEGRSGLMLSPYAGLSSPIGLQSWNHQLFVDTASDVRVEQFVDLFVYGRDESGTSFYPEPGASCENPLFVTTPLVPGDSSRQGGVSDAPTTPSAAGSAAPAPAP